MLTYHWLYPDDNDVKKCFALRDKIFVKEQGFADEFDEIDKACRHLLVMDGQRPIGVARVFADDPSQYHIGRIAVESDLRGSGIGTKLLSECERFCKEQGAKRVVLGAQVRAKGFYLSCGYTPFGEEYFEEYCPHIRMEKTL